MILLNIEKDWIQYLVSFSKHNLDFEEAPTSRELTLSYQGNNFEFRSTNSKDTNPSNSEAPTPRDPTLSFKAPTLFVWGSNLQGTNPPGSNPLLYFF